MNAHGNVPAGTTALPFLITTNAADGSAVAPNSAFEAADFLLYKDGGSTQRNTTAGWTITSPFDSVTGLHELLIDLTDNTHNGFYSVGSFYHLVLSPDETVDGKTVVAVVGTFRIVAAEATAGYPYATVKSGTGTGEIKLTSGIAEVNLTQITGQATTAAAPVTVPALIASTTNITSAAGCAVSSIGNNVITANSIASDAITDAKVAADVTIASVTGAVGSVTGAVGSVTGNVGGNVTGSVGSVVGAVGSVAGDVGGDVVGSVGSVDTGGIASSSFAAGAIDAAALAADASTEIVTAILAATIETGLTLKNCLRVLAAAAAGKLSGASTTTIVIRNAAADDKDRITATVDSSGNRSAITLDLT